MAETPNLPARIAESVRYIISSVTPQTWMSPQQPLQPMAPPETKGRAWDYPVAYNQRITPRGTEFVGFPKLRALAEGCPILRIVLERQKDLLEGFNWQVKPKEMKKGDRPSESKYAGEIKAIEDFLRYPDRNMDWSQWLRALMEDVFVIDAATIYRRPTVGGGLYALELIDGATIRPNIDQDGRPPVDPNPAYQQVLKGIPAVDFTRAELLYYPRNPRTNRAYGMSPVQMIIDYVETAMQRLASQKAFFTEGNINAGIFTGPEDWSSDQVQAWQVYWDTMFAGNINARRNGLWVPNGSDFKAIKADPLKDEFDEWLARVICFTFSTSPAPFIKIQNRGNQENQQAVAEDGGIKNYLNFIRRMMNRVIDQDFNAPHLEFSFEMDEEFDPYIAAQMDDLAIRNGSSLIDEVRDGRGVDPLPNGLGSKPIIITGGGAMLLEDALAPPEPQEATGPGSGEPGAGPAGGKPAGSASKKALAKRAIDAPSMDRPEIKTAETKASEAVFAVLKRAAASVEEQLRPLVKLTGDELAKAEADDPSDGLDLDVVNLISDELEPILGEVAAGAGEEFVAQIGVDHHRDLVDQVNDRAVKFASERGAELVGKKLVAGHLVDSPTAGISETTRTMLRATIAEGLKENIGWAAIRDRILDGYAFSSTRADLIAHTEIARANMQGSLIGARLVQTAGLRMKKKWLLGLQPCDVCKTNHAMGFIALEADFPSGDDAPPGHPRCYCSITYDAEEPGE